MMGWHPFTVPPFHVKVTVFSYQICTGIRDNISISKGFKTFLYYSLQLTMSARVATMPG